MAIDTRMALIAGIDIPIPQCRLILHQPTIRELAFIGETSFFMGAQTLGLHKTMFVNQDKDVLEEVSNFQIFMTVMNERDMSEKREAVQMVLNMLFPDYTVLLTPQSILFQPTQEEEVLLVDESNFEALQAVIRDVFCLKTGPMDQTAFNPADEQARQIAEKLMRGRQRVAEQKKTNNISIFSLYLSTLTVGLHSMSLHDLLNCTLYQLYDLMERYSLFMHWDLDVRTRLAGGKPDSQPDNWMKNIH